MAQNDLKRASARLAARCRQRKMLATSCAEVQDFLRALEAAQRSAAQESATAQKPPAS